MENLLRNQMGKQSRIKKDRKKTKLSLKYFHATLVKDKIKSTLIHQRVRTKGFWGVKISFTGMSLMMKMPVSVKGHVYVVIFAPLKLTEPQWVNKMDLFILAEVH